MTNSIKGKIDKYKLFILAIIFPIIASIFLLHFSIVGQAVYGDGIYYYAFTRSLVIDRDLNFTNEYSHRYSNYDNNTDIKEKFSLDNLKASNPQNKYFIGAPLAWIPGFFIAHLMANAINLTGFNLAVNGYSDIYQITVGLSGVIFVISGLIILYLFLKRFFSPLISLLSVLFMLFGSNLLYYGSIDVINSHPSSFLLGTIFFAYWWEVIRKRSFRKIFILGLIIGCLALTRTNDLIFAAPVIIELLYSLYVKYKKNTPTVFKNFCKNVFVLISGVLTAFLPQMVVWQVFYGGFWKSPYIPGLLTSELHVFNPNFFDALFYKNSGLFLWTPIFIFCLIGLIWGVRKYKFIRTISLLALSVQFYIISSWGFGRLNEAYGNRFIISSIPFLTFGLACFLEIVKNKFNLKIAYLLFTFLITLNFVLIFYFMLYVKGVSDTTIQSRQKVEKIIIKIINFP